jgi:hypothetical protein
MQDAPIESRITPQSIVIVSVAALAFWYFVLRKKRA